MRSVFSLFRGIKAKLYVMVILPILVFVSLSWLAISAMDQQRKDSNMIARDRLPKLETIMMVRVQANALMRFMWTAAAAKDPQLRKDKGAEALQRYEKLKEHRDRFAGFKLSDKMREYFAPLAKAVDDMEVPLKKSIAMLEADVAELDVYMMAELVPHVNTITAKAGESSELLSAQVEKEIASAEQAATNGENHVIYLSAIGGLSLIIYGFLMASRLYKAMDKVSTSISSTQEEVLSASKALAAASYQASAGTTEAASALEETVASIEELTSMVKINADSSKTASQLSLANIQSATEGEIEIRNLISSMQDISNSSGKIQEITAVIDDIAFQTNLLALNASVEAARAGEQGRGFAVVAEAVRTLSQRSALAAKDISNLIKENVERVDKGAQIADRSGTILQNILTSVKKVADLNNEIAAASGEQASGIAQITKAMAELDTSVQQNAQASEEVAASSETMQAQAVVLDGSVQELAALIHGPHDGEKESVVPAPQKAVRPKAIKKAVSDRKVAGASEESSLLIPFDEDEGAGRGKLSSVSDF